MKSSQSTHYLLQPSLLDIFMRKTENDNIVHAYEITRQYAVE